MLLTRARHYTYTELHASYHYFFEILIASLKNNAYLCNPKQNLPKTKKNLYINLKQRNASKETT